MRPRASSASTSGSRWPATSASGMSRPEAVSTLEATLDSSGARVLQGLVQPLGLAAALLDHRGPVPGQVAQLPDRRGRHDPGAHQAVGDQLADPHRVGHVGLAPGDVVQVLGAGQPALDLVFQQVEDRPPVDPGRLHADQRDPLASQPVLQGQQLAGGGPKGVDLLAALTPLAWHACTRRDRISVHVQAGAALDQPLHCPLLPLGGRDRGGAQRSLIMKRLRFVLAAIVEGARDSRVQLTGK